MKIFTLLFRLRVAQCLFAALFCAARAAAASYDFNPDNPYGGDLPALVGPGSSPVYITNTNAAEAEGSASVDSLRVGQRGRLNIGFDIDRAASAPVTLLVNEGMEVNGGTVRIHPDGALRARAGGDADSDIIVRNGGRVVVNAGLPPRDSDEMTSEGDWVFQGLGIGDGLDLQQGGLLQTGENGATVDGADGSAVTVRRGGYLDVSRNDMLARGIGEINVDGTYRSGVGSQLTSENGSIVFGADAKTVLSTDLYRRINTAGVGAADSIARARDIEFAGGAPASIRSGMGFYDLAVVPFEDADIVDPPVVRSGSGEELHVVGASRVVTGDGGAADRTQFRDNLGAIWNNPVEASQAEVIYDLLAARYPSIEASGEAGEFNRDVLESLMNGPGVGIPARGVADRGTAELYNGGAQWGANTVAFNTAELFMAGLDRRVQRIGAELDRLGHEEVIASPPAVASESANAGLMLSGLAGLLSPEGGDGGGRFWSGALYAQDKAELDQGIAGYKYSPRGAMLGYDKTIGSWSLGGAAAFARGDFEDNAATENSSEIDSYSAGLFAAYHGRDGFNASAFATASALDNSLADTRGGMRREADFTAYAWSAGARLGYDMLLNDRLMLQPSVGLTHVRARTDSHDESLDGIRVLRVGDVTRDGTLLPLDLTLGYDLLRNFDSLLRLNAGIGYAYDLGGSAPEGSLSYAGLAGAPDVNIIGRKAGRHRLSAGLGLLYTRERFDFSARYEYVRRDAQTAHQANTQLGVKF